MLRTCSSIVVLLGAVRGSLLANEPADAALDRSIASIRMATLEIHGPPRTVVHVEQLRHAFWFGAAISNSPFSRLAGTEDALRYKETFLRNFNAAVTENALKWHVMERQQGRVDYSIVDAILQWTERHQIPLRGHNIFWGVENRVPDWQKRMSDEQLRRVLEKRARDIGRRYRGRFAEYDLNNEMMHDDYYARRLGPDITRQMADWVLAEDPRAVLFLNDYDVLTGNRLADYVKHVKRMQEMGVALGGLGAQGHLHAETFDAQALQASLDTLARFQLPLRITEFNMPGQRSAYIRKGRSQLSPEQERAKAEALVRYYRICFAHPAVQGILMWGFWEGANWIPASSLYRRDWTPTPAAEAYRDLVYKQWWTRWEGKTDDDGTAVARVFQGQHRVTGAGKSQVVKIPAGTKSLRVSLQ